MLWLGYELGYARYRITQSIFPVAQYIHWIIAQDLEKSDMLLWERNFRSFHLMLSMS